MIGNHLTRGTRLLFGKNEPCLLVGMDPFSAADAGVENLVGTTLASHADGVMSLILQRPRDPAEPLVDRRNLRLQGFDLRPGRRVHDPNGCPATRALHDRKLSAATDRREQRNFKTMSGALYAC